LPDIRLKAKGKYLWLIPEIPLRYVPDVGLRAFVPDISSVVLTAVFNFIPTSMLLSTSAIALLAFGLVGLSQQALKPLREVS
jgi:hypothetical protein